MAASGTSATCDDDVRTSHIGSISDIERARRKGRFWPLSGRSHLNMRPHHRDRVPEIAMGIRIAGPGHRGGTDFEIIVALR